MVAVGVDIGGTFTDLVVVEAGGLRVHKLLSTPTDPTSALLAGLAALGALAAERIAHGTTVATNAILERKGARSALLMTRGLRDVLAIARQARPDLYALQPRLLPPLIPRDRCFEVTERLDMHGDILLPIDLADLAVQIEGLHAARIESVAICLLYSFVNPIHEHAARDAILASGLLPADRIVLSSDVLPEFREYERASTVALDAYVRPVIDRYLGRLEAALTADRPRQRLLIMKSDGGLVRAATARRQAVQTALSGPAAGVIGAAHLARISGFAQVISLDIGGTSTDVALIDGVPGRRTETQIDGLPVRLPTIDIETVGAGGGSIARLDIGGALRVGPQSAGADPGPIAYGRGGNAVTVSDAQVVLGRLVPDHFLGGAMPLDVRAANDAITTLGAAAGLGRPALAAGILDIANAHIDRAIRRVSIERGHDPRRFALMAFGGAGPLHACAVADRLGIATILIPRYPGVLCALGLLVADIQRNYSQTILRPADPDTLASLGAHAAALSAQAAADLAAEGVAPDQMVFAHALDLRYRGQSYELTIPFAADPVAAFHAAHLHRYGYARPERPIEIVTLRLTATGTVPKPVFPAAPLLPSDGAAALLGTRPVWAGATEVPTRFYARDHLRPGDTFPGPALIIQLDSTTWVEPGWTATVDAWLALVVRREQ